MPRAGSISLSIAHRRWPIIGGCLRDGSAYGRSGLVVGVVAGSRVPQGSQVFGFAGGEGVAAQAVEVRVTERGEPGDVLVAHLLPALAQVLDDGVEVAGVPEHDGVEDESEGGELVFLAFAVGLPD